MAARFSWKALARPPQGQFGVPLAAQLKPGIGRPEGRSEPHLGRCLGKKQARKKAFETPSQDAPGRRLRQGQLHPGEAIGGAKPFLRRGHIHHGQGQPLPLHARKAPEHRQGRRPGQGQPIPRGQLRTHGGRQQGRPRGG